MNTIIETILEMGMPEIVASFTIQAYEKWRTVIIFKAAYMIFTATISTLIFYSYGGETLSRALLAGMTFFTSFIGLVALALGGVGYVDRVHEGLLPVITYSSLKGKCFASRTVVRKISTVATVMLCACGGVLYFAGGTIQSL